MSDADDWKAECLRWRDEAEAGNYDELIAERDRLRRWKAEATEIIEGLHDLGRALGIPLGEQVTGPLAIQYAKGLKAKADNEQRAAQHYREQRDEAMANHAKAVEHGIVVGEAWEKTLDRADALASALERTQANLLLAINGKPVRDLAENLAENEAALIAPMTTEEPS